MKHIVALTRGNFFFGLLSSFEKFFHFFLLLHLERLFLGIRLREVLMTTVMQVSESWVFIFEVIGNLLSFRAKDNKLLWSFLHHEILVHTIAAKNVCEGEGEKTFIDSFW